LNPRPAGSLFIYDKETGERLEWETSGLSFKIADAYKDVIAIYEYNYLKGATIARIG